MQTEIAPQYDVVIVGTGPAGMTAAVKLSEYGLRVAVFDEQAQPGGQIYRNVQNADALLAKVLANDTLSRSTVKIGSELVERFVASDANYFPESLVWNLENPKAIAVKRHGKVYQTSGRYVVLATGAQERPVAFKGWQLPGVMGVGAAQIMLKSAGAIPQMPPVLYGSGPLLYSYAAQLIASDVALAAVLDTTTPQNSMRSLKYLTNALKATKYLKDGVRLLGILRAANVPYYKNVTSLKAFGESELQGVEFTARGKVASLQTNLLLSHHGVIPELQLLRAAGVECSWNESSQSWHPSLDEWGATSIEGVYVCGDNAGINGAYSAIYNAELASFDVLFQIGAVTALERDKLTASPRKKSAQDKSIRPFLESKYRVPDSLLHPSGDTIVCRCECVTAEQIVEAVDQGCRGPSQVKTFTRCGMGACQGRMCGPTVEAIVAHRSGCPRAEVGHFRARPPVRPISLAALASLDPSQG